MKWHLFNPHRTPKGVRCAACGLTKEEGNHKKPEQKKEPKI